MTKEEFLAMAEWYEEPVTLNDNVIVREFESGDTFADFFLLLSNAGIDICDDDIEFEICVGGVDHDGEILLFAPKSWDW